LPVRLDHLRVGVEPSGFDEFEQMVLAVRPYGEHLDWRQLTSHP
jgi:hypothetical protein